MHPLVDTMIEAAAQAGHERNPDFNGARQEGVGRFQLTQRDGLRCSAADAFLHPAAERPNLEYHQRDGAADPLRGRPRRRRRGRARRRASSSSAPSAR